MDLATNLLDLHMRLVSTQIKNNNEEITITNEASKFNTFNFPWTVNINGISIDNTAIEINNFINKTCPGLLSNEKRIKMLYTLVKWLYQDSF